MLKLTLHPIFRAFINKFAYADKGKEWINSMLNTKFEPSGLPQL